MYDFIYKRKRLVQFVLALITLPFAFFGVDYYFRNTDRAGEVATVAGTPITQVDFANALRDQEQRMQQALGANYDPAMFQDPEMRYSVLEQLIGERLLQEQARRDRLSVSDEQLRQFISEIPAFQEDGKFSQTRYEQLLSMQNPPRSPVEFAQSIRQGLAMAPLEEPITKANIIAKSNVERYLGLLDQQREVAAASIDAESYLKDVRIDDAAVKAFYDANQQAFQVPEAVKLEYVTLTPDALERADRDRSRRGQEAVRRQPAPLRQGRGARRGAYPDCGQTRRLRIGQGRGEGESGGYPRPGEEEPEPVRRAGEEILAGHRLGGTGRRPGVLRPRRVDGEALRGRGVRHEGGRDRRSGAERLRLARDQAHRHPPGAAAVLRPGKVADRAGYETAAGDGQVRRGRRRAAEPGL